MGVEQAVAAPLCTKHLRELGADVIKVELPETGDLARNYDDFVNGDSSHFVWLNRGKRSLALDIRRPSGQQVFDRLLATSDVLVANLAPSALDRYLHDRAIAERHPRLIRCYITGYGVEGPYRDRKAFDLLIQGEAGVTMSTGTPDRPAKSGVSLADLSAGTYAFAAVCAALLGREQSARGCRIDVSLFDAATEWLMPLLLAAQFAGADIEPRGLHHATIAPYGAYPTRDGRLVNIAVQTTAQWISLCEALGLRQLGADPSLLTARERYRQRALVDERVARAVALLTEEDLVAALTNADVPWGSLRKPMEVLEHPQLRASARWQKARLTSGDAARVLGGPLAIDGAFAGEGTVPSVGEHSREILAALGYGSDAAESLASEGAVKLS